MTKAERETYKAEFITGNYRTLKEFAEAKGEDYSTLRGYAKGWRKAKEEHSKQIADNLLTHDQEKRVATAQERKSATLDVCALLRKKIEETANKEDLTASDINALASACYRLKEVESDLLGYDRQDDSSTDKVIVNINVEDCEGDSDE